MDEQHKERSKTVVTGPSFYGYGLGSPSKPWWTPTRMAPVPNRYNHHFANQTGVWYNPLNLTNFPSPPHVSSPGLPPFVGSQSALPAQPPCLPPPPPPEPIIPQQLFETPTMFQSPPPPPQTGRSVRMFDSSGTSRESTYTPLSYYHAPLRSTSTSVARQHKPKMSPHQRRMSKLTPEQRERYLERSKMNARENYSKRKVREMNGHLNRGSGRYEPIDAGKFDRKFGTVRLSLQSLLICLLFSNSTRFSL